MSKRHARSPGHRLSAPARLLLGLGLLLISFASAAAPAPRSSQFGIKGVVARAAVVNFRDLARQEAAVPKKPERRVIPFMPGPTAFPLPEGISVPRASVSPPPAPPGPPLAPSPAPATSFEALGDNNAHIPPDTQGAVGPDHLMVTLNSEIRIQNRSGGEISKVTLESFWSSTGASGVFDPKLTYDPFNSRWIFVAVSDAETANSSLLVGVSQTNNPTGSWNLFKIDADTPTDTRWADYPSLGFNKDWVVVSVNMFPNAGGSFVEGRIYALNKANLYAGTSASFTRFADSNAFALVPAVTYDNSLATEYLVQNWNGNSMGNGFLRLSSITGAVGSESFTAQVTFVSTANPWQSSPPGGNDFAPQMDTTNKIQNNDSRILNVVYRNSSLWATQTVFLPAMGMPDHSAAQWWQFDPDSTVHQFGRVEDTNAVLFFAFPTIAVNSQDDVLIGYSSFSANQFASANYSFRAGTDTPSTLRDSALLKAGEATYFKTFGGPDNRWGDYSATVVDPVNDLDLWTIQEYASSPDFPNGDDRWGTWWGKIAIGTSALKKRKSQVTSE